MASFTWLLHAHVRNKGHAQSKIVTQLHHTTKPFLSSPNPTYSLTLDPGLPTSPRRVKKWIAMHVHPDSTRGGQLFCFKCRAGLILSLSLRPGHNANQ